ncbi:MAG TPA: D-alanyl-D-alanine carboxypeptidase family protein [Pyrinomonadaceae bacterium]|nr:D-alanyl-D-alanine carboxypeptidase family protein [Pyrinomonadaceae bacterium]
MSAKNKRKVWRFGSIFIIAAAGSLLFGCRIKLAERSLPIIVTNIAVNKSQPANSVISNSMPNEANNRANAETSETFPNSSAKKSPANSRFDFAVARNLNLAKNLVWAFGGKLQRGWYLYRPLICQAVGVEIEASENDFAAGLSNWQRANGLPPNGILDEVALAVLVTKWQANRLKIRGYPSPNELLVAPTADFYDVSRPDELRQVQRETYAAYKKLVAAAIADKSLNLANNGRGELAPSEKFLKIVSAFRSREYQNKLRRETPNSGRAGLAVGNSPHFTGRALDVYVGGDPVITKDENRFVQINTPVYQWLVKNAERFGFKPYFYEPWHWEYAPD